MEYLRHNQRRQEHLASLGLPIAGKTVLETGAGIGDHTSFFRDRGCLVTVTDGRPENVALLRSRFPHLEVVRLDLDHPDPTFRCCAQIVYCYGTLYHLSRPAEALAYLSDRCGEMLLLETCVSPGEGEHLNLVAEQAHNPSQALSGTGCRPTRQWIHSQLKRHFAFAYVTSTQPWHEQFPLDWNAARQAAGLTRSVFVASRKPLDNPLLCESIPTRQSRH